MSLPRIWRSSASDICSRSLPSKMISPEMRALEARVSPISVIEETDLPEPDSPTIPSVSPLSTEYEMPSTAFTTPSSVSKWTRRSLISSRGIRRPLVADPRVEEGVGDVDEQVEHDDRH